MSFSQNPFIRHSKYPLLFAPVSQSWVTIVCQELVGTVQCFRKSFKRALSIAEFVDKINSFLRKGKRSWATVLCLPVRILTLPLVSSYFTFSFELALRLKKEWLLQNTGFRVVLVVWDYWMLVCTTLSFPVLLSFWWLFVEGWTMNVFRWNFCWINHLTNSFRKRVVVRLFHSCRH